VQQTKHGQSLCKTLHRAGTKVEYVDGGDDIEVRRAAVKRLVRGDIDVLICTVIFNEGIDIPLLQSVVIASGGASSIAAIQRVGRGMRKASGKDTFEVWDVRDQGNKWLERHTKARLKAYAIEAYEVQNAPP
jgi:superfamily II DNA or RNA helicase